MSDQKCASAAVPTLRGLLTPGGLHVVTLAYGDPSRVVRHGSAGRNVLGENAELVALSVGEHGPPLVRAVA
jgi:hypothetical protein